MKLDFRRLRREDVKAKIYWNFWLKIRRWCDLYSVCVSPTGSNISIFHTILFKIIKICNFKQTIYTKVRNPNGTRFAYLIDFDFDIYHCGTRVTFETRDSKVVARLLQCVARGVETKPVLPVGPNRIMLYNIIYHNITDIPYTIIQIKHVDSIPRLFVRINRKESIHITRHTTNKAIVMVRISRSPWYMLLTGPYLTFFQYLAHFHLENLYCII